MTSGDQLSFRPFCRDDLAAYAAWFDDAEVARRISFPDPAWIAYVMDPSSIAHAVVAVRMSDDTPLAVLQYDEEAEGGINLLIAVDPVRRGQGFGKRVLAAFVEHIHGRHTYIDCYVDDDNLASIACVEHCRFIRQAAEPDDGFLVYRKLLGAES
jgi:RimJ/RimL family protein N-acetyltransferase